LEESGECAIFTDLTDLQISHIHFNRKNPKTNESLNSALENSLSKTADFLPKIKEKNNGYKMDEMDERRRSAQSSQYGRHLERCCR
jgi:hypothetical protein